MVGHALQAAETLAKEGISAEVVNLRSIRPLDREGVTASVMKTGRIVTVEEGWPQSGVGAEIIAMLADTGAFEHLDAIPERVTGADVPMPYAHNLEVKAVPQPDTIVAAARRACYRAQ
jgi:pyruvate dehydrogenase E1 component beta subunit